MYIVGILLQCRWDERECRHEKMWHRNVVAHLQEQKCADFFGWVKVHIVRCTDMRSICIMWRVVCIVPKKSSSAMTIHERWLHDLGPMPPEFHPSLPSLLKLECHQPSHQDQQHHVSVIWVQKCQNYKISLSFLTHALKSWYLVKLALLTWLWGSSALAIESLPSGQWVLSISATWAFVNTPF